MESMKNHMARSNQIQVSDHYSSDQNGKKIIKAEVWKFLNTVWVGASERMI